MHISKPKEKKTKKKKLKTARRLLILNALVT